MHRKTLSLSLALLAILTLSACSISFNGSDSDKDAKITELEQKLEDLQKNTVIPESNEVVPTVTPTTTEPAETSTETSTTTEPAKTPYTGPSFITLSSPKNETQFHTEPINFTGTVSPNTTKIVVTAKMSYMVGDDPAQEDIYRLQNFKYGDTTFKYAAKRSYNNLLDGSNKYTFTAYFDDSTTKSTTVTIFFTDPSTAEMGKPVIYLYPETTQDVEINVAPTNGVSVSIPALGDGWNVTASPDGTLVNKADGQVYPYLFWEGYAANFVTPSEGFVVAKNDVSKFFDEKLGYMGLNGKEITDFKEFWVPRLNENTYYFITFVPQATFDKYAPLNVTPTPDTVIRVFFDYKGLDAPVKVVPQTLTKGERKGFTVIEWGGRLY